MSNSAVSNKSLSLRANPPILMNEREISLFLGLSERTVRTYTGNGVIPVIRVGRRKIFRRDAVLAALKKLER